MDEVIATPIGLIINHYSVAIREREAQEMESELPRLAQFIDIAFCVIDPESGDEFYSLATTYSMN
jgi:hypothetical protein